MDNDVTKKLVHRLQETDCWKSELQQTIQDLIAETGLLLEQKIRLERALATTEVPLHISTDCLKCREKRQATDDVQDNAELALIKEVEMINNVQDLLNNTIQETNIQIRNNRSAKQKLEMDWSDKSEALKIDVESGALSNSSTQARFKPGATAFQNMQSEPETWSSFSRDNVAHAEQERQASRRLRDVIENVLRDITRDLLNQADHVGVVFRERINEVHTSIVELTNQLQQVLTETVRQEKNIQELTQAIKDKEAPMKVAQTRLYNRTRRPGMDNCRDLAHYRTMGEVSSISESISALVEKLHSVEESLRRLTQMRMVLEKEIVAKQNSWFIDGEKCLSIRQHFPSADRLMGFN
ncbi:PREDICTED: tektin-4-like [Priapulus caudatus]|uniref:Tektin n=1 Tax=Priapulus caudatus TaxID=37621 RepID=A0ABM1DVZ4_PRICU|nr:PREDICTED: tektin-4-like [Priapulus caudatus]